ncbi:MAG: translation initiation factor 2 [Mailhella sp.]|nr:translation initiation factor 2 [Mailhella sp.]
MPKAYIASSFKNIHGVRLLSSRMRDMGYVVLDWTEKAFPPEGLKPSERREWMDTDHGGEVFAFCARACTQADLVVYFGASGQDAGVEVGMAAASGIPVLGIRGPLESPGLMLNGAVSFWAETIGQALGLLERAAVEGPDAVFRKVPPVREC